jgi:DNA repair exonuclease SbcCD ATPase subunit
MIRVRFLGIAGFPHGVSATLDLISETSMKDLILYNAEEINRLHSRVHETFKDRDKGERQFQEWKQACEEFKDKYNSLAFPGGLEGAYERILSGNVEAIETGLSFLESRPYFFRSGYMFKDILRKLKKAPLDRKQRVRLEVIMARYDNYRKNRRKADAQSGVSGDTTQRRP